MSAEQLLDAALSKVESESIRAWANTPHNRPIWLEIAGKAIVKHNGNPDVSMFTAYIVCTAIGA